ncbi:hypothetical protein Tsubulata_035781 [Turnera subulata]|uniref:Protein kinase domain-containing protein n=1 Tax=Turnera subulata TaxID=218843 RepID=A0A9Q0FUJ2_9ROSI|nr:hypothetical protein Tsubulata_035781 [Turnera subulata]
MDLGRGIYQFGKMFRGELDGKLATVKTWDIPQEVRGQRFETETRLRDEIVLLHQYPKFISHPNLVKLFGYCHEGDRLGVVYDLIPVDTVYNLLPKGSSLSKCSFVHPSLEVERGFCGSDGLELTKLATQCVGSDPNLRPTVRQVIKRLRKLHVVRNYADELGINEM